MAAARLLHKAATFQRGPMAVYQQMLLKKKIKENAHQLQAVAMLQNLHDEMVQWGEPRIVEQHISRTRESKLESPDFSWVDREKDSFSLTSLFRGTGGLGRLFDLGKEAAIRGPTGLYLYGGVGTGKSMMMDLFYNTMEIKRKRRVHFHQFMQDIHQKIHKLKQQGQTHDPIPAIAAHLSANAYLLCFDELQVTNIVDAMLLRRLFGVLMDHGVVMVTTSNRPPDDLYQNGIQRQSFLPTIALLKERCHVFNLDGGLDYRQQEQGRIQVYFRTGNEATSKALGTALKVLAKGNPIQPRTLSIWGRDMVIQETSGRVAKISFAQLCGEARSAAEYLAIAREFEVLIISDIPRLSLATRNEARRFITLIDAIYDNHVNLIASFETNLADLFYGEEAPVKQDRILVDDLNLNEQELKSSIFSGDEEIFAFKRAVSRLVEMRGINYWPQYPALFEGNKL